MTAIIVINYKKFDVTMECVQSIIKTADIPYKIYILENGSKNQSQQLLEEKFGDNQNIEIIVSNKNLGYARGNNLCLKKAKSDGCQTAIIANSDIVFYDDAIKTLVNDIEKSDCVIAAPLLKTPSNSNQCSVKLFPYSFKKYLFFETYLRNFVSKKKLLKSRQLPKEKQNVYWVSGACFATDLNMFEKIGYFDAFTFLYYEEYIISEKAKANNLSICFDPTAKVLHHHGASAGGTANLFTRTENFRSEMYFLNRYWHWSKAKLKAVRFVRCLEVIFTFFKANKKSDAIKFVKESKKILKEETNH